MSEPLKNVRVRTRKHSKYTDLQAGMAEHGQTELLLCFSRVLYVQALNLWFSYGLASPC